MKKYIIYSILLFTFATTFSQSWQWGKRGGSITEVSVNFNFGVRPEEAYSIVTDSQKNIYMLSRVGDSNLNFDGVPRTIYESVSSPADLAIVSFACDGTFRWSKIIGGSGNEMFLNLQVDSQDNIYLAGRFGNIATINSGHQYIDDDVVIPIVPSDYRTLVIIKYNSSGDLQWYKRPEPNVMSLSTLSSRLEIDEQGNLYWLVDLASTGSYADGAFTVSDVSKPWHVLKYNSSGNFISATVLDLQTPLTFSNVEFYRNPNNGRFFVTVRALGDAGSIWATVGSETVTRNLFLACFSPAGEALWRRENASNNANMSIYNLLFAGNDIFIGGSMLGFNSDTFMGLTIPEFGAPGYLMRIDQNATGMIWSTYHNRGATGLGGLVMKGDEIGFTDFCSGTNFVWGTQTLNATGSNQGNDVLFARLNKNTGECLSLTKIPGSAGFDDYGCALAVDASGDYIVGGNFSGTLTFDGGLQVTNNGGQSDFFIAKYATQACSPLGVAENEFQNLTHYPNPTTGLLNLDASTPLSYELFDLKGVLVMKGTTSPTESKIDLSGFEVGTYILKMVNENGGVSSFKVVKF